MRLVFVTCLAAAVLAGEAQAGGDMAVSPSAHLDLPITEIRETHPPHEAFCTRLPAYCDLSGPREIAFSAELLQVLARVNASVNRRFACEASDKELFGVEEFWTYPEDGVGDCEDAVILKREELVRHGLPRGAMTIALVYHRSIPSAHAVLLVETSAGTFLLNSVVDDVGPWHGAPYNFEARERPDGRWERYDQETWVFE